MRLSGNSIVYEYAGATDRGRWRARNEDTYYIPDGAGPDHLLIVADGMGGYRAGDTASEKATHTVRDMLVPVRGIKAANESAEQRILRAIARANDVVRAHAEQAEECRGMGTTLVVALLDGTEWVIANVGDSRAYCYSQRSVRQITVDHSLVQEMVDAGRLTREEAAVHIHRNIITRAIGTEESVLVDTYRVALSPGEMLMLCSDGLNEHLSDQEIARILSGRAALQKKAQALIAAANKRGGRDNITVVLAACREVSA